MPDSRAFLEQLIALGERAKTQPVEVQIELDHLFEQNPELKVAADRIIQGARPENVPADDRSPEITLTPPSKEVAFVFDFDETLTKKNTAWPFVQEATGLSADEVAQRLQKFKTQGVHAGKVFEALITERFHELNEEGRGLKKEDFAGYCAKFEPAEGLTGENNFFDRMRSYAAERGLHMQFHISSANIENIPASSVIAHEFDTISGQRLIFNAETGFAESFGEGVDFTTKTRHVSQISKGIVDESRDDHLLVNRRMPTVVPIKNMVAVGDGETDVAFMAMTQSHGGAAFGVFEPEHPTHNTEILREDARPTELLAKDYREGSPLDMAFKSQIDKIAVRVQNDQAIYDKTVEGKTMASSEHAVEEAHAVKA